MPEWVSDWIVLIFLPVIGFVFGYYHKAVVCPRFQSAEKRLESIEEYHGTSIKDMTEVKTDVKWIKSYLEKNGKR